MEKTFKGSVRIAIRRVDFKIATNTLKGYRSDIKAVQMEMMPQASTEDEVDHLNEKIGRLRDRCEDYIERGKREM